MALNRHKSITKIPSNHLQDPSHQKSSKYMCRASFVHHWTKRSKGLLRGRSMWNKVTKAMISELNLFSQTTLDQHYNECKCLVKVKSI